MKSTSIEEYGQAVSRKRLAHEYVDLVVLELAHIFFPAKGVIPFRVVVLFASQIRGSQRQLCQDSDAGLDQRFFR